MFNVVTFASLRLQYIPYPPPPPKNKNLDKIKINEKIIFLNFFIMDIFIFFL
jgi:hypothetical protein